MLAATLPLRPATLPGLLRRARPPSAREVTEAIATWEARAAFEGLVRPWFPGPAEAAAILGARQPGWSREGARVTAFVERFSERYFPLVFCEEYEELIGEVPWERQGLGWDEVSQFNGPLGQLLLIIAVLGDVTPSLDAHCDELHREHGIRRETLALIPRGQRALEDLEAALGGGPHAATVDMARWLYQCTGSCFLDLTWEYEVVDNEGWTGAYVADLAEQWRHARALIERVDALARHLEATPDRHFATLLRAVAAAPGRYPIWHASASRAPAGETIGAEALGRGAAFDGGDWPTDPRDPVVGRRLGGGGGRTEG